MTSPIEHIVIVGGGTAGWLTACILASEFQRLSWNPSVKVSLIESPNIPTLGVGEGTWPSMRSTLQAIGLAESAFVTTCSASFKQGTLFEDWLHDGHRYIHPFTPPLREGLTDMGAAWLGPESESSFAWSTCPSASLAFGDRAPKQITTPEYAFAANYGYHLDAGAFAQLFTQHGVEQLGVKHHRLILKRHCFLTRVRLKHSLQKAGSASRQTSTSIAPAPTPFCWVEHLHATHRSVKHIIQ